MCRSMSRGVGRERVLHPNLARGYGSRQGMRGDRRYQVPLLLSDSFEIWEDFTVTS